MRRTALWGLALFGGAPAAVLVALKVSDALALVYGP